MVYLPNATHIAECAIRHLDIPFNLIHYTIFSSFPTLDRVFECMLAQNKRKGTPILPIESMIREENRLIVAFYTLSVQ